VTEGDSIPGCQREKNSSKKPRGSRSWGEGGTRVWKGGGDPKDKSSSNPARGHRSKPKPSDQKGGIGSGSTVKKLPRNTYLRRTPAQARRT